MELFMFQGLRWGSITWSVIVCAYSTAGKGERSTAGKGER